MSLNIFGFTAAVWAMTERVSWSILSTALQHGQVTSKFGGLFAIERIIPQNRVHRGGDRLRRRGPSVIRIQMYVRTFLTGTLWKTLTLPFQQCSCQERMYVHLDTYNAGTT